MIKNITSHGVRGVNLTSDLQELNILQGDNGSGKSTIIQMIHDIHKGKTKIKKGDFTLTNKDGVTLFSKNGALIGSPGLSNDMDLMYPGFFMNGTPIDGVNKTTEDKRKTISDLLGIDREGFFAEKGIDYDIKGLRSKLRDTLTKETTYASEIIEEERAMKLLEVVKKPKKVKQILSNKIEIDNLNAQLDALVDQRRKIINLHDPIHTELVQGNIENKNRLMNELDLIIAEGKKANELLDNNKACLSCGQLISDIASFKESIKERYRNKAAEINAFVLIESNEKDYNNYLICKNQYDVEQENIKFNTLLEEKIKLKADELSNIKVQKGNEEEYDTYLTELRAYDLYESTLKMHEERVARMTERIGSLDSTSIQDQITVYKNAERDFVEFVQNKLTIGDLKIIFYRELMTPNTDGDIFTPTFNIEYKGKLYDECSGGQKGIIDIILARIFIQSKGIIDFILIDNAEISTKNLKKIITDELSGLQVIATRIGTGKIKVLHNFV